MTDDEIVHKVVLRDYSKGLFFYPVALISVLFWIISAVNEAAAGWLALIWMLFFFFNLSVVVFDISPKQFIILILLIIIGGMLYYFLGNKGDGTSDINYSTLLTEKMPSLDASFYGWMTAIFGTILFFVFLQTRINFLVLEANEFYAKSFGGEAHRYPTNNMGINVNISDVFEALAARAGRMEFSIPNHKTIVLNTVPFAMKKKEKIDSMLSEVKVSVNKTF